MQLTDTHISILIKTKLFEGICASDAKALLSCLRARLSAYEANSDIIFEQSEIRDIGVIVSGSAYAYKTDLSGKRIIMTMLEAGSVFGEVLSASLKKKSPVTVTATEPVLVVLIPNDGVVSRCVQACLRHEKLLLNLMDIISCKYFDLHERISCIIRPTLREKILFYLRGCSKNAGNCVFTIPFDRAALAEYLNADRSALSRELSAMKREGVIDYYKNSFRLLRH